MTVRVGDVVYFRDHVVQWIAGVTVRSAELRDYAAIVCEVLNPTMVDLQVLATASTAGRSAFNVELSYDSQKPLTWRPRE